MVSQTQPEVEDVDSDDEDDYLGPHSTESDFHSVVDDVNSVLNPDNIGETDDYIQSLDTVLLLVYSNYKSLTRLVI
jgi:hypothetical protein